MALTRLLKHFFYPGWWSHRLFPEASMRRIEAAIADSERRHHGEICFAVETNLDVLPLLRGQDTRGRALEVFSEQRVWDTEANNGVLIYLLLADRQVEIVADRDLARRVENEHWQQCCRDMEARFAKGEFEAAVLGGIAAIDDELCRFYPRDAGGGADVNELSNRPIRL